MIYSPYFGQPIGSVSPPVSQSTPSTCTSQSTCINSSTAKTPLQQIISEIDWLDIVIIVGAILFFALIGFAIGRVV